MKNAFTDAFDALQELIVSAQDDYKQVLVGSLPANDSMVVASSAGYETNTALDLSGDLDLDFVLNAKHADQRAALNALNNVHYTLSRMYDFPKGEGWQILSISTSSMPTFIEKDGDQFTYGSGLRVLLYLE